LEFRREKGEGRREKGEGRRCENARKMREKRKTKKSVKN